MDGLSAPALRLALSRQLSSQILITWLLRRRRSRMAMAITGSSKTSPTGEGAVAGGQQAAALVAARDELDEQLCRPDSRDR